MTGVTDPAATGMQMFTTTGTTTGTAASGGAVDPDKEKDLGTYEKAISITLALPVDLAAKVAIIDAKIREFGGSTAQVPLPKHERLIAHLHGNQQVAVSVFEVDPSLFKTTAAVKASKDVKAPPAGYKGRPQ